MTVDLASIVRRERQWSLTVTLAGIVRPVRRISGEEWTRLRDRAAYTHPDNAACVAELFTDDACCDVAAWTPAEVEAAAASIAVYYGESVLFQGRLIAIGEVRRLLKKEGDSHV